MLSAVSHDVRVLSTWMRRRAAATPDRPAITFEGTTWTYAELWERISMGAKVLRDKGIGPGDRLAYVGQNNPLLFVALFAAGEVGAILVLLNVRLTGPELAQLLGIADVSMVLADADREPTIAAIRGELPDCRHYLAAEPGGTWPHWLDEPGTTGEPADITADAPLVIMFTSGTTGVSKGVVLTHGNIWGGMLNGALSLEYGPRETTAVLGPMFHTAGFSSTNMWTWSRGGHVIFYRDFDPEALLRDIPRFGIRSLGVPTAILMLLARSPRFADADLSTLKLIYVGGLALSAETIAAFEAKGIAIQGAYGSTESTVMTILPAEYALEKRTSVGRPAMLTEVRLLADDGSYVDAPEAIGEVVVQGPNIFSGYWRNDEANAESFTAAGWFRTGDVGRFDKDGFLYLVDRRKDLIKTGGESVSPREIEAVLGQHPAIQEVAVVGMPHEKWGETPVAAAILRPGATLTLEDLREFAGDRLARFKHPTRLVIVEDFPRSGSGKVLKYRLRDQLGTT